MSWNEIGIYNICSVTDLPQVVPRCYSDKTKYAAHRRQIKYYCRLNRRLSHNRRFSASKVFISHNRLPRLWPYIQCIGTANKVSPQYLSIIRSFTIFPLITPTTSVTSSFNGRTFHRDVSAHPIACLSAIVILLHPWRPSWIWMRRNARSLYRVSCGVHLFRVATFYSRTVEQMKECGSDHLLTPLCLDFTKSEQKNCPMWRASAASTGDWQNSMDCAFIRWAPQESRFVDHK